MPILILRHAADGCRYDAAPLTLRAIFTRYAMRDTARYAQMSGDDKARRAALWRRAQGAAHGGMSKAREHTLASRAARCYEALCAFTRSASDARSAAAGECASAHAAADAADAAPR